MYIIRKQLNSGSLESEWNTYPLLLSEVSTVASLCSSDTEGVWLPGRLQGWTIMGSGKQPIGWSTLGSGQLLRDGYNLGSG